MIQSVEDRLGRLDTPPLGGAVTDLRLDADGVAIHRGFLDRDLAERLADELQPVFAKPILNRRRSTSIWLQRGVKVAATPTALRSVNLLELCIDVRRLIPPEVGTNLVVTNLEVFSDTAEDRVFWHTDRRRGMVRAMLYVEGGGERSGGFRYMRGTHACDHTVEHALRPDEVDALSNRETLCHGEPGDLVLFDSFGFHSKGICESERMTVMIEFQPRDSEHPKASIDLNTRALSASVLEDIALFAPGSAESYGSHGADLHRTNDHVSFRLLRLVTGETIGLFLRTIGYRLRTGMRDLGSRRRRR